MIDRRRALLTELQRAENVFIIKPTSKTLSLEIDWDGSPVNFISFAILGKDVQYPGYRMAVCGATYGSYSGQSYAVISSTGRDWYGTDVGLTVTSDKIRLNLLRGQQYFCPNYNYIVTVNTQISN